MIAGCSIKAEDETGTETGTETETGAETGAETGEPQTCAAFDECGEDQWCDFPDNACGAGLLGTCEPQPDFEGCGDDSEIRVCACNGSMPERGCASGIALNADASACDPFPGYFPCGPLLCQSAIYYCQVQLSDVGDEPDDYRCVRLPNTCGQVADCECLSDEPCSESCEATGVGLTLTCPGG